MQSDALATIPTALTLTLTLRTNLADYPVTLAMKDGRVTSDSVRLDHRGPKSAHDGFKPMLRENAFDVGEMAIATYLQARIHKKPYVLIPAPTVGRLQHRSIVYNRAFGALAPRDIEGRKVGVRAYTQTTGLWVRGILQHAFGVDLDGVTWVTVEAPHVAEFQDPPNCLRLPGSTSLTQMMLEGELSAVILGYGIPGNPDVTTLIPDAERAAHEWYAQEGVTPINHMVAIHEDIARNRPDVVREIYRMLGASRALAPDAAANLPPMGLAANRKGLAMAIDWSYEQKLIPRGMSVDALFDDTTANLN